MTHSLSLQPRPATDEHSQNKLYTHHPSQPAQAGFAVRSPQIYLPDALSHAYDAYFVNVHQSPGKGSEQAIRK
jgi:hypothetical protein